MSVSFQPVRVTYAGLIKRLLVGHCSRWHPDAPMAGIESSPAIDEEIIPNGSLLATRLRGLDQKRTLMKSAFPVQLQSIKGTRYRSGHFNHMGINHPGLKIAMAQ